MRFLKYLAFCASLAYCFDYNLEPIKITNNAYYFYGKEEYFNKSNGGNIVNTSFIITNKNVILIDTGSTQEYGKQVIQSIKKITNKPIKYIINTHHHPDHFLGNNAFTNSTIYANKYTTNEIKNHGDLYITNMANLIEDAAYTTRLKVPNNELLKKELNLDDVNLKVIFLDGHTKSDIVLFDKKNKILYSSDLVFHQRALATPHANIPKWIKSLEKLKTLNYEILVPGHGKIDYEKKAIDENIEYLKFIDNTLKNAVIEGLDTFEILSMPIPEEFKNYSMFKEEFERTIINLYPKYENGTM